MSQNAYSIDLDNNNVNGRRRSSGASFVSQQQQQQQQHNHSDDLLVDTNSIPIAHFQHQAPMPSPSQALIPTQIRAANSPELEDSAPLVVSQQPLGSGGKVAPESQNVAYSVHPAFAHLDQLDTLLVKQRVACERTCCGFESTNAYTVRSKRGDPVLRAVESSSCCERCCCESNREYSLKLTVGEEVVARIVKPYRVSRFCCYSSALRVESPEDNPIGAIKQVFTFFGYSKFAIYDSQHTANKPMFVIESVSCRFCCNIFLFTCFCPNSGFRVIRCATDPTIDANNSIESRQVATISRNFALNQQDAASWAAGSSSACGTQSADCIEMAPQTSLSTNNDEWQAGGTATNKSATSNDNQDPQGNGETATNGDCQQTDASKFDENKQQIRQCPMFGIQFDTDLEPRHKVLLLAACFMLDFFYFEPKDRRRRKLYSS